MNCSKPLIACFGLALAFPAMAADDPSGDYSSLHPKAEMEEAPAYLGRGTLVELTATVEDVDHKSRFVTLKGPEGKLATIKAGPEVKNFGQIKKGDQVNVGYYQAMAVDVIAPGEEKTGSGTEADAVAVRAKPGEKPAGAVARTERTQVKILSVDQYKKAVAFRGPEDGRYREVSMDAPHLEPYLKTLKDGDTVEVIYTEALAVSVTPK